jgi:hypothetical protein
MKSSKLFVSTLNPGFSNLTEKFGSIRRPGTCFNPIHDFLPTALTARMLLHTWLVTGLTCSTSQFSLDAFRLAYACSNSACTLSHAASAASNSARAFSNSAHSALRVASTATHAAYVVYALSHAALAFSSSRHSFSSSASLYFTRVISPSDYLWSSRQHPLKPIFDEGYPKKSGDESYWKYNNSENERGGPKNHRSNDGPRYADTDDRGDKR